MRPWMTLISWSYSLQKSAIWSSALPAA
jgi:hypothetical protein